MKLFSKGKMEVRIPPPLQDLRLRHVSRKMGAYKYLDKAIPHFLIFILPSLTLYHSKKRNVFHGMESAVQGSLPQNI